MCNLARSAKLGKARNEMEHIFAVESYIDPDSKLGIIIAINTP